MRTATDVVNVAGYFLGDPCEKLVVVVHIGVVVDHQESVGHHLGVLSHQVVELIFVHLSGIRLPILLEITLEICIKQHSVISVRPNGRRCKLDVLRVEDIERLVMASSIVIILESVVESNVLAVIIVPEHRDSWVDPVLVLFIFEMIQIDFNPLLLSLHDRFQGFG